MYTAILGVTAAVRKRHYGIAHRPLTDRGSGSDNFAGNFESWQMTRVRR